MQESFIADGEIYIDAVLNAWCLVLVDRGWLIVSGFGSWYLWVVSGTFQCCWCWFGSPWRVCFLYMGLLTIFILRMVKIVNNLLNVICFIILLDMDLGTPCAYNQYIFFWEKCLLKTKFCIWKCLTKNKNEFYLNCVKDVKLLLNMNPPKEQTTILKYLNIKDKIVEACLMCASINSSQNDSTQLS